MKEITRLFLDSTKDNDEDASKSNSSKKENEQLPKSSSEFPQQVAKPIAQQAGSLFCIRQKLSMAGSQIRLPPARNPALQVIRQRPSPCPQYQNPGLTAPEPERESAKMLVILDNGEQRLITFMWPKETCTVQELLDQVGIHVGADSNIECIENPGSEIDYIMTVANFATRDIPAMTKAAENHIHQQQQHKRKLVLSPDLPPAKFVNGFYAVCAACGFSGKDHAKCQRCHQMFTEEPKTVKIPIGGTMQTHKTVAIGRVGNLDKKKIPSTSRGRSPRGPRKAVLPEVLTLSSDDKEDFVESKQSATEKGKEKMQ
jgi:hypothetical protein